MLLPASLPLLHSYGQTDLRVTGTYDFYGRLIVSGLDGGSITVVHGAGGEDAHKNLVGVYCFGHCQRSVWDEESNSESSVKGVRFCVPPEAIVHEVVPIELARMLSPPPDYVRQPSPLMSFNALIQ